MYSRSFQLLDGWWTGPIWRPEFCSIADQVGFNEYGTRYLQPAGRQTTTSRVERAVYAER